jgi:predicted DNA-binding transcriptional regulator AlpA
MDDMTAKKAKVEPTVRVVDLVGLQEMAVLLGVSVTTVWNWTKRYADFPPAITVVSRCRVWDWQHIAAWDLARNR